MKNFKRNAVIIAVLVFVCAAVYLNWTYAQETEAARKLSAEKTAELTGTKSAEGESGGLFYTPVASEGGETQDTGETVAAEPEAEPTELEEYFAKVRLTRSRARDEAAATLETVAGSDAASQETIDEALAQMAKIAGWTLKEAELENLINSKGFTDCVVYISDDGITVTTALEGGLSPASVAKVTDVVLNETDFTADQLTVVEVKATDT